MNWLKFAYLIVELGMKIAKDDLPGSKELAQRIIDAGLDWIEEYAVTTETTVDDKVLAKLRAILAVPEFDDAAKTVTP